MSKKYTGKALDVTFDGRRCIHAAECVNRLQAVFDTDKRPWIQPDNAPADQLAEVIERCPSGALVYERQDGGAAEVPDPQNTIRLVADGPLYARGQITLAGEAETRVALCRCGASEHKPYCDNSHKESGFRASGNMPAGGGENGASTGELNINLASNGPLLLQGNFELLDAAGKVVFQGEKAALCRCGASMNKPFCDGTHKTIGFEAE